MTKAKTILRAKKLGVLIRDARQVSSRSIEECAQAIEVTEQDFQKYELGDLSPSLPEIEMLAYFLGLPVEHFWGSATVAVQGKQDSKMKTQLVLGIRQRLVGAMLRKARTEAGISLEGLSQSSGYEVEQLKAFELGETPIPIPALDLLAEALGYQTKFFLDHHGPLGVWSKQQEALKEFKELPIDLQAFVSKPVNRPYLELAQRLSNMSVEKLRAIAEGLLEITY